MNNIFDTVPDTIAVKAPVEVPGGDLRAGTHLATPPRAPFGPPSELPNRRPRGPRESSPGLPRRAPHPLSPEVPGRAPRDSPGPPKPPPRRSLGAPSRGQRKWRSHLKI